MTISEALRQLGLSDLIPTFDQEGVRADDVAALGNEELIALGVTRLGDRLRLRELTSGVPGPKPSTLGGGTRVAGSTGSGPTPLSMRSSLSTPPRGSAPNPNSLSGGTRIAGGSSNTGGTGSAEVEMPERIGSYLILGLLGQGGMGSVFRARHVEEGWAKRQGGDVAIKLVHPTLAEDSSFRERFFAEAELGKRVQHASIVATHEVLAEGSHLGMVMALVEGEPLSIHIRPGGLALSEVVTLLRPVADGLDHLHTLGIVHRDVKPANILIKTNGEPVILDLGIAKDSTSGDNQTRTATAIGTMAWMAPEQADAKHVDGAADRYALGLVTYALLAGRMPWGNQASEYRVVAMKLGGQLEPLGSVVSVPAGVDTAITKMLALEPSDRFSSCKAFVDALAEASSGQTSQLSKPATPPMPTAALPIPVPTATLPIPVPTAAPPIPEPTAALPIPVPSPAAWPAPSYAPPQQRTPPPIQGESEEVRRARTWFMWSLASVLLCGGCFAVLPIVVGWQGYQAALRGESAESQINTVRGSLMLGGTLWFLYFLVICCGGMTR